MKLYQSIDGESLFSPELNSKVFMLVLGKQVILWFYFKSEGLFWKLIWNLKAFQGFIVVPLQEIPTLKLNS